MNLWHRSYLRGLAVSGYLYRVGRLVAEKVHDREHVEQLDCAVAERNQLGLTRRHADAPTAAGEGNTPAATTVAHSPAAVSQPMYNLLQPKGSL